MGAQEACVTSGLRQKAPGWACSLFLPFLESEKSYIVESLPASIPETHAEQNTPCTKLDMSELEAYSVMSLKFHSSFVIAI